MWRFHHQEQGNSEAHEDEAELIAMELVSLALQGLQNMAEVAASYRLGQAALRQLDRALWVYEKCARWAVPPPLDADERPQPELVRPLPWILFLMMLVVLRVSRESISLLNLARGRPPLRSADVVTFFQSKRRYLRTLKYQGARVMRARSAAPRPSWWASFYRLCELTMCFRRESAYGNNNSTRVSNNDEVMLTNATTPKSSGSDATATPETTLQNKTPSNLNGSLNGDDIHFSPGHNVSSSTPEEANHIDSRKSLTDPDSTAKKELNRELEDNNISEIPNTGKSQMEKFRENLASPTSSDYTTCDESSPQRKLAGKQLSENFIERESERTRKRESKIGNGRTVKSVPNKKKGPQRDRLASTEVSPARVLTSNNSF